MNILRAASQGSNFTGSYKKEHNVIFYQILISKFLKTSYVLLYHVILFSCIYKIDEFITCALKEAFLKT